ncbi:MAG: dienelactone hydrolase family protein [Labilithrix sp.]|nr:dienelactone hydrolase family protein [Labilithrix sp.]
MTDLQKYLAEEIAVDHVDGHLTRREALRRLALLGLGAAAASSMLAACANEKASQPAPAPTGAPSGDAAPPAAPSAALPAEAITFAGPEGRTLQGSWSAAAKPRGGVLVIHENKGLTDHFKQLPGRFAAAGYAALAIDLLSEEGGTASLGDPANATAALNKVPVERFVADMRAGLDEIARRAPGVKLGAIGFCFGGAMTWQLIASKDPRLAAAAPFYGPLPSGADFTGSKAAVLGVFAEKDARVNATRDAAKEALAKAGLTHEIVTYPGVDHAFFNDTGPRYDANAAAQAWAKVLEWFGRHVG